MPFAGGYHLPETPPSPWMQSDPADSSYRVATQMLNRGDYRKAAAMFKDIPVRFQYSAYAPEAMYWQAMALYRIGNTPDLQEALTVLEALKQKYPNTRARAQRDVPELSMRIAGTLSTRGLAGDDHVKRALAQGGGNSCDSEDQSVRAQALSALMETDADAAAQMAQRILAKKDECSVQLRRNAVMIVSRKRDAQTLATLTAVAKSDPSSEVRQSAVRYLAGMPGDDALAAIEELLKSSDDQNVQREAVRVLVTHSSPRARQAARAIVERNDAQESLRLSALRAFDRERSTTEDATWLRSIYPKVENPRVKAEIVSTITRIGGEGMDQWLLALAKDENESLEARSNAVRRAAQTMDIPNLGKFYDSVAQQQLRSSIIDALSNRPEGAATDKLLDIVKTGTDPRLREQAIYALTRKKDPRTTQLLLDVIDKKVP
jgi:HEAT repeat protein